MSTDEVRARIILSGAGAISESDVMLAKGAGSPILGFNVRASKQAQALAERDLRFGIQTRIDLWKPEMLELLGRAGCVSIEAGVESLSAEGRELLDKDCRIDTETLTARLIEAKQHVAFVQGNLIGVATDRPETVQAWRERLRQNGVWANEPVPLFPYPGSPDYRKLWGEADDDAWERAHHHYVTRHGQFSDLQDEHPLPLAALEQTSAEGAPA